MTKRDMSTRVKGLLRTMVYWVAAFTLYDLIRNTGLTARTGQPFDWLISIELAVLTGCITGLLDFLLENLVDADVFRRKSYGIRMSLKTLIFFCILIFGI